MTPLASIDRTSRLVVMGSLALALAASSAAADITITSKTSSEGLGGFGNSNGTSTRVVTKDRSVDENETEYTGRFKTFAGGKKKSVQIVRLDRGVIWSVDPEKKQYSEMTFEEMRASMRQAMDEMNKESPQMEQAKAQAAAEAESSDVTITFETDVKRTGEKQTLAGLPCEHVVITSLSKMKDAKSGAEAGATKFTMDGWYSKEVPGGDDVMAFDRAFAEKLGMNDLARQMTPMATAMYGDAMKEIAKKLEGLGYPMKSTFTVETVQSEETQKQTAEAREAQEKARAEGKEEEKKAESAEDAAAAAAMGADAAKGGGGLKGMVGGFMGRKLGKAASKKAEEKAEAHADKAANGASSGVLLRATTEVVAISSAPAAESRFEVPAGFKKVEAKTARGK